MSIRSAIAIYNKKDDSWDAVYCHQDGTPDHHIPILTTEYKTAAAVRELIAPGDISNLRTSLNWFLKPKNPGPLYYIDRGEINCDPRNMTLEEMRIWAENCYCDYLYTFIPRKGWKCESIPA